MKIVKLEQKDSSLFKSFKKEEWPEADKEHYGSQQPDFSKHSFTFVAKKEVEILGYIFFTIEQGVAYIDSLIVGKKIRRQGVAKQLMEKAENEAKSVGAHKIYLETGIDWDAKHLYELLGYKVRVILPNHYGHRDFVLMDKEL